MRRFLLADLHFGRGDLNELIRIVQFCVQQAVDRSCDSFEILGDLFESKTLLMFKIWPEIYDVLDSIIQNGLQLRILAGNHDFYHTNTRKPSNLRHVNLPKGVEVVDELSRDGDIMYIPWLFPDEELDIPHDIKCILGHIPVVGASLSPYMKADSGVDPERLKDVKVYLGHFHTQQKVSENVMYLGNPRHATWNDANQEKYGYIIDDTHEIIEAIRLNDLFVNLIKIDYNDIDRKIEIPKGSKVTLTNVPVGEEVLVAEAIKELGASAVICLNAETALDMKDNDDQTIPVDDAIMTQIEGHDMREELTDFHKLLCKA